MWRTSISRPAASPDAPSPAERRPIERILARDRLIVLVSLLAVAGLSWLWLLRAPMRHATDVWTAAYLLPTFLMWALMMVAMMLPSAAPMILLHARFARGAMPAGALASTALFALAYLAIWLLFSLAAALAQGWLVASGPMSAMALAVGDRQLAGGMLVLAGLYQLTPLKRACLDHCRSPLSVIMSEWREGPGGAFLMGLRHGAYCTGCCWILMALLFVAGVMNLLWIAMIAVFVLVEKAAPQGQWVGRVAGLALIVAGAYMIAG